MSTAVIPTPTPTPRPTPEQLDDLAARYFAAKKTLADAKTDFDKIEDECVNSVTLFGVVPPNAEQSRRLDGKTTQFTVTTGNTTTVDEARVQDRKEALEANKVEFLFQNLFTPRVRHETAKGSEVAILAAALPKRLTEKLQQMYSRCFSSKKKEPSLKVKTVVVKMPKAKKAKAEAK